MANLKRGTPKGKKAPQSKTRQSPRGRRNANRDPTPEQSSESEHEEQEQQEDQEEQSLSEQSNSEGSNDQSYDFLGRAPSNAVSESTVVSAADDNIGGASSTNQTPQRVSTRPSTQQPSTDGRKSRKQTQPKKRRKDRVTKELVKLQRTTKLLIPRLPFQRYEFLTFFYLTLQTGFLINFSIISVWCAR